MYMNPLSFISVQNPFNISLHDLTSCCAAAEENSKLVFHDTSVVILQSHNECDNQYCPVRGVDRLRNSRLVTSDPEAKRKRLDGGGGWGHSLSFTPLLKCSA